MFQILLIEQDRASALGVIDACIHQNWQITHYRDLDPSIRESQKHAYSLIIIGKAPKPIPASVLCRKLRYAGIDTPILILSGQYNVDDAVEAFDAGADSYLAKPFSMRELTARVHALLLRAPRQSTHKITLSELNLEVDKQQRLVTHQGETIGLRRREFEILLLLAENQDRVFTRSNINQRTAVGYVDSSDNCIDVHISNIRKALGKHGCEEMIETVHGVGYRMNCHLHSERYPATRASSHEPNNSAASSAELFS